MPASSLPHASSRIFRVVLTFAIGILCVGQSNFFFRIDAILGVPAENAVGILVVPMALLTVGIVVATRSRRSPGSGRGGRLGRAAAIFLVPLGLLAFSHPWLVVSDSATGEAVVVSWSRASDCCVGVESDLACVRGLMHEEDYDRCWGKWKRSVARAGLTLVYAATLVGFGICLSLLLIGPDPYPVPPSPAKGKDTDEVEEGRGSIFMSYAREDSAFTQELAENLHAAGLRVWLDQRDIPPGAPWDEEVAAALSAARTMVVVLSPDSIASKNVLDEISYAEDRGRRIVPVLHRQCEIPLRLIRRHYVDFSQGDESALHELIETLRQSEIPTPTDELG